MDVCEFEDSLVYKSYLQDGFQSYRETLSRKTKQNKTKILKNKEKGEEMQSTLFFNHLGFIITYDK